MNIPKSLVRSMYDIQHIRIQTGNRIVVEIKSRMGQLPGEKEETIEAEGKMYLEAARSEYKRIADAFVLNKANHYFKVPYEDYAIISDPAMLLFIQIYMRQLQDEEEMLKVIAKTVEKHPLWDAFLKDTKGCGPLMSAVILSEFDPHKARYISSFWKYAGLDVAEDGRGRGRYSEHLVETEYVDKEEKKQTRKSITFNPFLKTKLVGVLGSCFIKIKDSKYRKIYDDYKYRLETHSKYKDDSKGHRHNMAVRYMIKIFLQDLWIAWRKIENLPISKPYAVTKLGYEEHAK